MRFKETMQDSINIDYWFLRDCGVLALTAIYIVGLAYKEDVVIIGLPRKRQNGAKIHSKLMKEKEKFVKLEEI